MSIEIELTFSHPFLRLMQAFVSCLAWSGVPDAKTATTIQLSVALVRDSPIVLSVRSGDPGHGVPRSSRKNAYSKHGTLRAMHTQRFLISPSVAFISSYLGSKSGAMPGDRVGRVGVVKPRPPAKEFGCIDRSIQPWIEATM